MDEREGQGQGSQHQAAGEFGEKTHAEFIQELHARHGEREESKGAQQGENDVDEFGRPITGHHRRPDDHRQRDDAKKSDQADPLGG